MIFLLKEDFFNNYNIGIIFRLLSVEHAFRISWKLKISYSYKVCIYLKIKSIDLTIESNDHCSAMFCCMKQIYYSRKKRTKNGAIRKNKNRRTVV